MESIATFLADNSAVVSLIIFAFCVVMFVDSLIGASDFFIF